MPTETRRSGLVQSPKLAAAAHCFALPSVTNGTAFWGRLPCGQGRQTIHAETRMKEAFDPPNTQKSGDWLRKTRVCESSPTARLRSRVGSSISLSCTRRHPSALYLNSLKIPQDEQRSNVSTRYSVLTNVARTYSVAILTAGDPLIWAPKKREKRASFARAVWVRTQMFEKVEPSAQAAQATSDRFCADYLWTRNRHPRGCCRNPGKPRRKPGETQHQEKTQDLGPGRRIRTKCVQTKKAAIKMCPDTGAVNALTSRAFQTDLGSSNPTPK